MAGEISSGLLILFALACQVCMWFLINCDNLEHFYLNRPCRRLESVVEYRRCGNFPRMHASENLIFYDMCLLKRTIIYSQIGILLGNGKSHDAFFLCVLKSFIYIKNKDQSMIYRPFCSITLCHFSMIFIIHHSCACTIIIALSKLKNRC